MKYYAQHYHMKDSNVKTVIENIFFGFSNKRSLGLLYSNKQGNYKNKNIKCIKISELDYDNTNFLSKEHLLQKAAKLKEKIKKNIKTPCVLHCHNVNIFKNTYLGAALLALAKEYDEKEFLLIIQVHNFAEDNQNKSLKHMINCTGRPDPIFGTKIAYPIWKNIIYFVSNSRDKFLLNKVGIPKERIFLFPNPIDVKFLSTAPKNSEQLKSEIFKYAEKNKYPFNKERKIILNPAIISRKKNILESVLILKILNFNKNIWQLFIPFEPKKEADRKFYRELKKYIKEKNLPVVLGFGESLISKTKERTKKQPYNMVDLYSAADAILTSSPLEAFDYVFLEPWVAGTPVIGRRIEYLFKDFSKSGLNLKHFYEDIIIEDYDFKDFAILHQLKLLDTLDYSSVSELPGIKSTLFFIDSDNKKIIEDNKAAITKHYSIESINALLKKLIDKGFKLTVFKEKELDNSHVIEYFKEKEEKN